MRSYCVGYRTLPLWAVVSMRIDAYSARTLLIPRERHDKTVLAIVERTPHEDPARAIRRLSDCRRPAHRGGCQACSGQQEPAATTAATTPATTAATPADDDAPIPPTASPFDALPEAVRLVMDKPFTGDLDALVARRAIRVGVTFNRTHYFVDQGQERGLTYEVLKAFENDLNTDLKTGNLKVHVVIVPMTRDQLLPRAGVRQDRHGRGHGDRHPGAGETRRLLGPDSNQRQRGRRHRTRCAAHRLGRRSGWPGGVRP